MRKYLKIALVSLLHIANVTAQEVTEVEGSSLIDLDEMLFRADGLTSDDDIYYEAVKYYSSPVSQRRRGLDWWIGNELLAEKERAIEDFKAAIDLRRIRLFGSTRGYRIGGELLYSNVTRRGWNIATDIDIRSGRDVNVMGGFNHNFRGECTFGRDFGRNHYINIGITAPIMMEGLQGGASQEAIILTGDKLYNPAWGYYEGEVRNSRVRRYRVPELNLRYQRPIWGESVAAAIVNGEWGDRSLSRLGWYDGYNPTPDYYRKLPSYVADSDLRDDVEQLWRDQNSEYTQIAWDDLVRSNHSSEDGETYYIVEDQVERLARAETTLLVSTPLGDRVRMSYGARYQVENSRNYKELRDLLGGGYLTDIDQYIGDYSHLSNDMQNNLREPNRKILEGERFGYDYSLVSHSILGIARFDYRGDRVSFTLDGEFGEDNISRIGHYEKERFAGNLSYGRSKVVTLPASSIRAKLRYTPSARHALSIYVSKSSLPPENDNLFIQDQNANRIIDSPTSQNITSAELSYHYSSPQLMVDFVGYFTRLRDQTSTWQAYDDISYSYSDVVVSGIGTTSIGAEVVANYHVSNDFRLDMTLAAGDYTHDTAPIVTLYDDVDMSLHSTSEAEAVVGCKVGNAPQLLATIGATYFANNSVIFSADCSYAAGRYIAPSYMRRTDRVIRATASPEMEHAIVEQESLGDVFDLSISLTKTFWLSDNDRISLTLRVNNLLGERDRIDYGRESNRILRTSATSDTGVYYLQPSTYYYETPRSFYLSCNYLF